MDSRIRVFTGHFGSGKTEIAINYALKLSNEGNKVAIADLDIVNPYFCTRDETKMLENKGIRVIATPKDFANAELGIVPPETLSIFNDKSYEVVLDVGGDEQGAVALGQYNRYFREEDYDMYFVINTLRPFTNSIEGIIEYIKSIEAASRLKVKYLINNTNLSYETDIEHILKGQEIVKEVSNITNIPIRYVTVMEDITNKLPDSFEGEIFPIKLFMLPPWRRFDV
ncbi:ATP-binding protein [Caloramator sp. E03]|uniref:nucleotide-binding protein n=1 Tax=Caloramator sp. E03 TaxID=2576307 RepID=UPI001110E305|nr:ATP-binding protein [Caloramator sp. E03]QCX34262.1 ATP-binding protein [Caloramator sp. E03]